MPTSSPRAKDAISLLRADHRLVSDLFEQFEKSRSPARKQVLVNQICKELTIHAQVEEELFYPAVKQALRDTELVPEARVEHESLKQLISKIQSLPPDDEAFKASVIVLSEYVKHHVKEEQNEMFPKVKASKLDLKALALAILERKHELMEQVPETGMA